MTLVPCTGSFSLHVVQAVWGPADLLNSDSEDVSQREGKMTVTS